MDILDPKTLKRGDKLVFCDASRSNIDSQKNLKTGEPFKVGDVVTVLDIYSSIVGDAFLAFEECEKRGWNPAAFRKQRFVETLQPGDEVKVTNFHNDTGLKLAFNKKTGKSVHIGDVLVVKKTSTRPFDWVSLEDVGGIFYAENFRKYTAIDKMCDIIAKQMARQLTDLSQLNALTVCDLSQLNNPIHFYDYPSLLVMGDMMAGKVNNAPNCPTCEARARVVAENKKAFESAYNNRLRPIGPVDALKVPGYQEGWNAGYGRGLKAAQRCNCNKFYLGMLVCLTDVEGRDHTKNACVMTKAPVKQGKCVHCGRVVAASSLDQIVHHANTDSDVLGWCTDKSACERARCGASATWPVPCQCGRAILPGKDSKVQHHAYVKCGTSVYDYSLYTVRRVPGVQHNVTDAPTDAKLLNGEGRCAWCGCIRKIEDLNANGNCFVNGALTCRDYNDCYRCCKARRTDANSKRGA